MLFLLSSSTMCILEGNGTLTSDLALTGLNAECIEISGLFFKTLKGSNNNLSFTRAEMFVTCIRACFYFVRIDFLLS